MLRIKSVTTSSREATRSSASDTGPESTRFMKMMNIVSAVLCLMAFVQCFVVPTGAAIPLFFGLLILAGLCGELSMTPKEQDELLARRKEMDKYGPSW